MRRGIVLVIAAAGCGRFRFEPVDDGSRDAAHPTADACTFGSFNPPRNISELNTGGPEYGGWLSPDMLELYYSAQTAGTSRIYHAHRASPAATFDPGVVVANLVASGSSDDPWISEDGLQLVFQGSPTTSGVDAQLMIAIRPDTSVEFVNGQVLSNVNDPTTQDSAPSLTGDGLTLIFTSRRAGGAGGLDLYTTTRPTLTSAFAPPSPIVSLNTNGSECCSSLASDGSFMVITADRTGVSRIMRTDYVGGVFQAPSELDPVLAGVSGDEVDPTLSRDGTQIVFSSNRVGGSGSYDLYIAERACQ